MSRDDSSYLRVTLHDLAEGASIGDRQAE